jgi:hypothetical protein
MKITTSEPAGAEARGDAALADVQADQELADAEQRRGDDGAEPDVVPAHLHPRHRACRSSRTRRRSSRKPISRFTTWATVSQPPKKPSHHLPRAEIAALSTSETISRKAMPRIMPNDSSRARSSFHQPAERSRAGARQIRSSASCSSPKTVVAPTSRRTTPIVVAAMPSAGLLTLASRPSIAWPASGAHQLRHLAEDLAARRLLAERQAGDRDHHQQQRRQRERRCSTTAPRPCSARSRRSRPRPRP